MIVIHKGQVNQFLVSADSEMPNPVYLFVLTNDFTGLSVGFIAKPTGAIGTLKEFEVEESETEDPLNGIILLAPTGFWKYRIYDQVSTTNLDPENANSLIENGKAQVKGSPYENNIYQNETLNSVYVNQ